MAEEVMQQAGNFLPRIDTRRNEVEVDSAMVALTAPGSVAAEQFRVLYHRLDRMRALQPMKVIALTSAVSGEGKSLSAANLALVAAAADPNRRVLLVDADLRRPRLHLLLGVDNRPGLGDFLAGEATLQEVVRRPRGSPLMVIPAGPPREDAGQLVGGATMKLFLEQARSHFDEIYLDAPPVLPVADGALLASMSDGVALVVRAGVTSRTLVGQAMETLAGTRLLGCVLNGVEASDVPYLTRNRVR